MAKRTITAEDYRHGWEPRTVVWDDETGEVAGDHSGVPLIRRRQEEAARDGRFVVDGGYFRMPDPWRDPACVKVLLLFTLDDPALPEPLRSADHQALGVAAPERPGVVY